MLGWKVNFNDTISSTFCAHLSAMGISLPSLALGTLKVMDCGSGDKERLAARSLSLVGDLLLPLAVPALLLLLEPSRDRPRPLFIIISLTMVSSGGASFMFLRSMRSSLLCPMLEGLERTKPWESESVLPPPATLLLRRPKFSPYSAILPTRVFLKDCGETDRGGALFS